MLYIKKHIIRNIRVKKMTKNSFDVWDIFEKKVQE